MELIDRQRALEVIDPERILPQWMVDYVKQQLRELPLEECVPAEPVKKPRKPRAKKETGPVSTPGHEPHGADDTVGNETLPGSDPVPYDGGPPTPFTRTEESSERIMHEVGGLSRPR